MMRIRTSGGEVNGDGKRQLLGIVNLDSPDVDCILPHFDVNARKSHHWRFFSSEYSIYKFPYFE